MRSIQSGLLILITLFFVGCGGGGSGGSAGEPVANKSDFDLFGNGVKGVVGFNSKGVVGSPEKKIEIKSVSANACKGEGVFSPANFTTSGDKEQKVTFSVPFDSKNFEACITNKIIFDYNLLLQGGKIPFKKEIISPTYSQDKVFRQNGGDPLYQYQWHLKNTAQSMGAATPAIAGEDINVEDVWEEENITGKGVTVAVIDSGIDMFHPDLEENLIMKYSHNYHTGNLLGEGGINNPTPVRYVVKQLDPEDGNEVSGGYYDYRHGTAVAGLIGAKGWNGIGSRGVAPDAKLVSYNALEVYAKEYKELFTKNLIPNLYGTAGLQHLRIIDALTRNLEHIDIYNNSWGNSGVLSYLVPQDKNYDETLKYGTVQGRDGKGAIYVKSAGNGPWTNFEQMQTNGYFIIVSASNADGKVSTYSSNGPNILVNAPGGGAQSEFVKPDIHNVVTTDMAGSKRGYDASIPYLSDTDHFNVKGNENYDYTNLMNGTSAAAPIVSGIVALMLEKNPNLTWRDVRYILARSAFKNDPTHTSWKRNGAGYWYSQVYGFGRADALNAVNMSKDFTSLGTYNNMKQIRDNGGANTNNQRGSFNGSVNINDDITIEHVAATLTIEFDVEVQYDEYNFNGVGDRTTTPIYLYENKAKNKRSQYDRKNIVTVTSRLDQNDTQTVVKLVEDGTSADDESAMEIATLNYVANKPIQRANKVADIKKSGNYKFLVESNATSWSINIKTPIPLAEANNTQILLTSPQGTISTLVPSSNGLDENQEYNNTRLSSVQFLDEKTNGEWKLEVSETKGRPFEMKKWYLDIMGR